LTGAWLVAAVGPSPTPFGQPPPPGVGVPELVIGGVLAALGIRSLVRWARTEFDAASLRDQVLFSMHVAARVGLWFAFAGFFLGLALVDEPGRFIRWYLFVPIGLAGVQLMTGVFLSRSPDRTRPSDRRRDGSLGEDLIMETDRLVLRKWSPEDAEAAFRIYGDPRVMGMMGLPLDRSVEETRSIGSSPISSSMGSACGR
jgi:hypothetical protein